MNMEGATAESGYMSKPVGVRRREEESEALLRAFRALNINN